MTRDFSGSRQLLTSRCLFFIVVAVPLLGTHAAYWLLTSGWKSASHCSRHGFGLAVN